MRIELINLQYQHKEINIMIHPDYAHYLAAPDKLSLVTLVTLIHPRHGTHTLYIPIDDFQSHLMGIIRDAWINSATIIIQPAQ